jgi:hypothetical protein
MELNLSSIKDALALDGDMVSLLSLPSTRSKATISSTRGGPWPEPDPRLSYQARPGLTELPSQTGPEALSRSRTWRVRLGLSGSPPGPCSTDLDWNLAPEARSRARRLRVGWSGSPSDDRTGAGAGPTAEHQVELTGRPGRSRMIRDHASVCQMC